jgi:hypothetical protein
LKSFYSIKIGIWDILQKYNIWFKKSPGPIKRVALSTLGFWVNVHPGSASERSFLEEIRGDLYVNYKNDSAILQKYEMPATYTPPNMCY